MMSTRAIVALCLLAAFGIAAVSADCPSNSGYKKFCYHKGNRYYKPTCHDNYWDYTGRCAKGLGCPSSYDHCEYGSPWCDSGSWNYSSCYCRASEGEDYEKSCKKSHKYAACAWDFDEGEYGWGCYRCSGEQDDCRDGYYNKCQKYHGKYQWRCYPYNSDK